MPFSVRSLQRSKKCSQTSASLTILPFDFSFFRIFKEGLSKRVTSPSREIQIIKDDVCKMMNIISFPIGIWVWIVLPFRSQTLRLLEEGAIKKWSLYRITELCLKWPKPIICVLIYSLLNCNSLEIMFFIISSESK